MKFENVEVAEFVIIAYEIRKDQLYCSYIPRVKDMFCMYCYGNLVY